MRRATDLVFYWAHLLLYSIRDKSDGFTEPDELLLQDNFGSGDFAIPASFLPPRQFKPDLRVKPAQSCDQPTSRAASQVAGTTTMFAAVLTPF